MKLHNSNSSPCRLLCLLFAALLLTACASSVQNLPGNFVELGQFAPDIRLEVRYFSSNNFVGEPIDGYQSAKIFMTRDAAEALLSVQRELQPFGLGLKVFDAYRPQQAVDHFVRWAEDLDDQRMKARYYPQVDKSNLFSDGYIASRSGHSRGSTVDLTLIDLASGEELDMDTPWDYFDLASWPDSDRVSTQQQANRLLLRKYMLEAGFAPLTTEWWHFTLADEPYRETYFDFPVR
jgi:D-alanyl-D-alanine dipeptidase